MPQVVGMLPLTAGSQVKSGVMPEAAAKLELAMIMRTPVPSFATFDGTTSSTWEALPSQLNAVSRVLPTMFCPARIRISTYWTLASPPTPDFTSSMTLRWKAARASVVTNTLRVATTAASVRCMGPPRSISTNEKPG
jgi:hypothetical protein